MKRSINIKGTVLDLSKPKVMGILNVTPDSFSDGGKYLDPNSAFEHAVLMKEQGASILDLGGFSSRPDAKSITVQEELDRVLPIIERVQELKIPISIDTFRSEVAKEAVNSGARIVNDISAGDDDPEMLETVAKLNVPFIAMHKQGKSANMQDNPKYFDVVDEVFEYLNKKKEECSALGIEDFIVDPGFGFGKTLDHNYLLLKNLDKFQELGVPLLAGISRKSMIYKYLGEQPATALNGTTFLHAYALEGGASILRVHDVKEAMECIALWEQISSV